MEILLSNDLSKKFYRNWVRDTKRSIYLAAPLFLLFSLTCFTLIVGISIKLSLIMILPALWIFFALIYRPLFIRKDYLNTLIESILIKDENITVSTYKWFADESITANFKSSEISFQRIKGIDFFKGKTVYRLSSSLLLEQNFYLIIEFFEDTNLIIEKLNIPCNDYLN